MNDAVLIEKLARVIWTVDGPKYHGLPVRLCYWDQHPQDRDRCRAIARAVVDALKDTP